MDRLLTMREFADRAGAPEATARYWVHIGSAPKSAKIGRRRMFRESEVEAWLDAHFESSGTGAAREQAAS